MSEWSWEGTDYNYITMTIVTGNETFPEQNITKEDFVPDDVTMVKLHIYYYLF